MCTVSANNATSLLKQASLADRNQKGRMYSKRNHSEVSYSQISSPYFRLGILLFTCLMTVGGHYGKHSMSGLATSILAHMNVSRAQFGLTFSLQELPGIFIPLLSGFLVSWMSINPQYLTGHRDLLPQTGFTAIVLALVLVVGQALCAFSLMMSDFPSMFSGAYPVLLLGRFVFGLGDSALVVLQGMIISQWFSKIRQNFNEDAPLPRSIDSDAHHSRPYICRDVMISESTRENTRYSSLVTDNHPSSGGQFISSVHYDESRHHTNRLEDWINSMGTTTAFGIMLAFSRLSTLASLALPATIAQRCTAGESCAMWVSVMVCSISLFAAIAFTMLEFKANRTLYSENKDAILINKPGPETLHDEQNLRNAHAVAIIDAGEGTNYQTFVRTGAGPRGQDDLEQAIDNLPQSPPSLFNLPLKFFNLCAVWMAAAASFFSFLHFAPDLLVTRYGLSSVSSGYVTAVIVFVASILSPVAGNYVDQRSYHSQATTWACTALAILLVPFLLWGTSHLNDGIIFLSLPVGTSTFLVAFLFLLMGAMFSVVPVTLLSMITSLLDPVVIGVGLGIFKGAENLSLPIVHYLAGWLRDISGTYVLSLLLFISLNIVAAFCSFLIFIDERKRKNSY